MNRKRKSKPSPKPDLAALLDLLELKKAVSQHCTALKATILLMEQGKSESARARLEGAVAGLEQVIRCQCQQLKMPCPGCGSDQGLEAWVDSHTCVACGHYLDPAGQDEPSI